MRGNRARAVAKRNLDAAIPQNRYKQTRASICRSPVNRHFVERHHRGHAVLSGRDAGAGRGSNRVSSAHQQAIRARFESGCCQPTDFCISARVRGEPRVSCVDQAVHELQPRVPPTACVGLRFDIHEPLVHGAIADNLTVTPG